MTSELIETFLAVLTYRTLTAAARHVHATQSTVSHRIQLLEQEVGTTLFERGRGRRSLEPTPAGAAFERIALQWQELFRLAADLPREAPRTEIVVGGADIIDSFTFAPFYQQLVSHHPEIRLRVRTHHSDELYEMLERQQVDVGFVLRELTYPDVVVRPLYREQMCLVCRDDSGYRDNVSLEELPAEREVFQNWSADYLAWHNRHWQPESHLVQTGTGAEAMRYLDEPGRWAIVPWSLYEAMGNPGRLVRRTLAETPPPRTCYEITHRNPLPRTARALEILQPQIDEYVEALLATGAAFERCS